jgi:DNA-binding NtrC family response regulator
VRKCFSPPALQRLRSYHWPGNVRELANIVQRAIVFSEGKQINACDIGIPECNDACFPGKFGAERKEVIRNFEREYVEDLLRRNGGNITRAAREAGKERRAFGRLVKKYAAQPPRGAGQ